MRAATLIITVILAAVAAEETRVPGVANLSQYREVVSLLRSANLVAYSHNCAGSLLNNRAVITAGSCVSDDAGSPGRWRLRVGSSQLNYGGRVYQASRIIVANNYDEWAIHNNVAIVHTNNNIAFGTYVQPGRFAGSNYAIPDNQILTTVGWGYLDFPFWSPGEFNQLRRVNQWSINLNTCRPPYAAQGFYIQNSQICSGFYNPSSIGSSSVRDRCFGEPGAPLYHFGVVVGIRSYGISCFNNAYVPSINTRVSSHIYWISNNA